MIEDYQTVKVAFIIYFHLSLIYLNFVNFQTIMEVFRIDCLTKINFKVNLNLQKIMEELLIGFFKQIILLSFASFL